MTPPLDTAFTRLVGCTAPIQQAAFGSSLNIPLVAAVSAAGGLGMIGAPLVPPEVLGAAIARVRERTPGPIGVNFVAPFFDADRDGPTLDLAAARARVVEFFYGDPDPALVDRVHAGGALASWQVGSLVEALAAEAVGCDLVVVQGVEAGGHVRGVRGLLPLLCDVLDRVEVPVLAAGGIASSRALAAVLAAGAGGARIGTAFVATEEADFHRDYQRALVEADGADTVYTDRFAAMWPDAPHRVLRGALEAAEAFPDPVVGRMPLGGKPIDVPTFAGLAPTGEATGEIGAMACFAGEGVGNVTAVRPAAAVVHELTAGAARLLGSAVEEEMAR